MNNIAHQMSRINFASKTISNPVETINGRVEMEHKRIRGLYLFQTNIRACKTTEDERLCVNKELKKIAKAFGRDAYQKQKSLLKLLYIFLLGYRDTDIFDQGLSVAVRLLASTRFSEKHHAYMFLANFLNANHRFLNEHHKTYGVLVRSLQTDLTSYLQPQVVCLALRFLANFPLNDDLTSELAPFVLQFIVPKVFDPDYLKTRRTFARFNVFEQRAACKDYSIKTDTLLCMLNMARQTPRAIFAVSLQLKYYPELLLELPSLLCVGLDMVCMRACVLFVGQLIQMQQFKREVRSCAEHLLFVLVTLKDMATECFVSGSVHERHYKNFPIPWLIMDVLKAFKLYRFPADQVRVHTRVLECLDFFCNRFWEWNRAIYTDDSLYLKKKDVGIFMNAIVFEAMDVIFYRAIHLNAREPNEHIRRRTTLLFERLPRMLLGWALDEKFVNGDKRFIALDCMRKYSSESRYVQDAINRIGTRAFTHILATERDASIKKATFDLVCSVCDAEKLPDVYDALYAFVNGVDEQFAIVYVKEDMLKRLGNVMFQRVVTVGCGVEVRTPEVEWLIPKALTFMSEQNYSIGSWMSSILLNVIANNEQIYSFCVEQADLALRNNRKNGDAMIACCCYILGEYPLVTQCIFNVYYTLQSQYVNCTHAETKRTILVALLKVIARDYTLATDAKRFFIQTARTQLVDVQQLAMECAMIVDRAIIIDWPPMNDRVVGGNRLARRSPESISPVHSQSCVASTFKPIACDAFYRAIEAEKGAVIPQEWFGSDDGLEVMWERLSDVTNSAGASFNPFLDDDSQVMEVFRGMNPFLP